MKIAPIHRAFSRSDIPQPTSSSYIPASTTARTCLRTSSATSAFREPHLQTPLPHPQDFERSCEIGLWRLTANRISEIFGVRLHKGLRGKLATVIDQIEHGHHVFRAYWKNAFLKQYEKFSRYSRFHPQPDFAHRPNSKLEAAYHEADKAIEAIVDLLAAA